MEQGGLHRRVAVCVGSQGLPVAHPTRGLALYHPPVPLLSPCSCTGASRVWDPVRCGGPRGPSAMGTRGGGGGTDGDLGPFPVADTCSGDGESELLKKREAPQAFLG